MIVSFEIIYIPKILFQVLIFLNLYFFLFFEHTPMKNDHNKFIAVNFLFKIIYEAKIPFEDLLF